MLGAYSGLIDIFVNFYDVEARVAFFIYASFVIKITGTSNKSFDQKVPDALALERFQILKHDRNVNLLFELSIL